jgi:hypothetical protein
MKKEIVLVLKADEAEKLLDEWTNRYDTCNETWAWYELDERIWKKLRDAVDDAHSKDIYDIDP